LVSIWNKLPVTSGQVVTLKDPPGPDRVTTLTVKGNIDMKFEIKRESGVLTLERQGATKPWRFLLMGIRSVQSVGGGAAESTAIGTLITPDIKADRLRILLISSE